jgi:hypothetical protein
VAVTTSGWYADDEQGDVPTADALRKAMQDWANFGNIRLQHDPSKPVGTIKYPAVGHLPAGVLLPVVNRKSGTISKPLPARRFHQR